MSEPENPVEKYIHEKYGELLRIYEDTVTHNSNIDQISASDGKKDYYSLLTFSTGYIIYLKNTRLGDDFNNGVPRTLLFEQGVKYPGNIRNITHIRYLPANPNSHKFPLGLIAVFEPEFIYIFHITTTLEKNGIEKYLSFPRPESITNAAIPEIRGFSWSRDDVCFHF
jgi:hypothetical protein